MMKKIYRMADKLISVDSIYEAVHEYCRDYLAEGEPDIVVGITQSDIDYERERSEKSAAAEGRKPCASSDSYLEELAVYRSISEQMPFYDTFLFHGSAVAVDGEAYLFTATSGTGKSTHTRLWRELFGDRAVMVNDDKPLIRADDDGLTVFGTPYDGKHRLGSNIAVPLKAVCILERAEVNSITPIDPDAAYPTMIRQAYRPADPDALARTLMLIDRMLDRAALYRLGANMDIEAARVAYNGMK